MFDSIALPLPLTELVVPTPQFTPLGRNLCAASEMGSNIALLIGVQTSHHVTVVSLFISFHFFDFFYFNDSNYNNICHIPRSSFEQFTSFHFCFIADLKLE